MKQLLFFLRRQIFILLIALFLIPSIGSAAEIEIENESETTGLGCKFTIVWLSDTQEYASTYPDIYNSMMDYIGKVREERNIVYVIHTGDQINDAYKGEDIQRANDAFLLLPDDLPVFTACGNHDYKKSYDNKGDYSIDYSPYLDNRKDTGILTEAEYLDGLDHYVEFSEGGMNFLLLTIAYKREKESIDWATQVCKEHPDSNVILVVHSFLSSSRYYTSSGEILHSSLLKASPNIRLVLCGHMHNAARLEEAFDDNDDGIPDRSVWELLYNYQGIGMGGKGFLRFLTIDPVSGDMAVETYSPWLDKYNYRERNDSFVLPGLFESRNNNEQS